MGGQVERRGERKGKGKGGGSEATTHQNAQPEGAEEEQDNNHGDVNSSVVVLVATARVTSAVFRTSITCGAGAIVRFGSRPLCLRFSTERHEVVSARLAVERNQRVERGRITDGAAPVV